MVSKSGGAFLRPQTATRMGWKACPAFKPRCEAAASLGLKAGPMFQPIRVAVCGRKNAPPLFETMVVLGRDVCLERIRQALENLQSLG